MEQLHNKNVVVLFLWGGCMLSCVWVLSQYCPLMNLRDLFRVQPHLHPRIAGIEAGTMEA